MPARKPQTPKPRDQIVAFDAKSDSGKERMISELARVQGDSGKRALDTESRLDDLVSAREITGSRASGDALVSLISALSAAGLIKDKTTP